MKQFDKRNLTMVMDFYELTMSNGYFREQDRDTRVAFDVFYRKNPDGGGYSIFAGLEQIIEYIQDLHFDDDDIAYLREQKIFEEDFLEYLRNFRFEGDLYAFPEGTIMYPNEPILTIVAPLIDAQLVETAVLLQVKQRRQAVSSGRRRAELSLILVPDVPTIWMRQYMVPGLHILAVSMERRQCSPEKCLGFR